MRTGRRQGRRGEGAGPGHGDGAGLGIGEASAAKASLAGKLGRLHGFKDVLLKSLARDDKRGQQIFDDYADFHDAPESDATMARLEKEVEALLARLEPIRRDAGL